MADPLAEALNRISANPQSADVPAPQPQAPQSVFGAMPRWQRVLGTTIPEVAASVVAAPTNLYGLLDLGSRWAFNTPLPGGEGARAISESITQPVRDFSNRLAGEPIQDNLLSGDPLQVGAAWLRLGLGAGISAPVGVARNIEAGGQLVRQGVAKLTAASQVADRVTTGLGKALEVLTPITVTSSPSWKAAAANVGVAGAIGAGVEAALGPADELSQAVAQADGIVAGASDAATQGAKEVKQGQQLQQAGFTTGDPVIDGAAAVAIAAAGLWGLRKRDVISRVTDGVLRGRSGYDVVDPHDATHQSRTTANKQRWAFAQESMVATHRKHLLSQGMKPADAWDAADRMAEDISFRTGPSVNTRLKSLYRIGEMPDSAIKFTPVDDMYTRFRALPTDAERKAVGDVLVAQQELNQRGTLLRDTFNAKVGAIGSKQAEQTVMLAEQQGFAPRHHLWNTSAKDLRKIIDDGMSNPQVASLVNDYKKFMVDMRSYFVEQKRYTKGEVDVMARENPVYVPTRLAPGQKYLNQADQSIRGGLNSFEEIGNPFEHLTRYIDEAVRSVEGAKVDRSFLVPLIKAAQQGDKFALKFVGRQNVNASPQSKDHIIHYRNEHGVAANVEIKDAMLRDALKSTSSPSTLQMMNGAMSTAARIFEHGSVGAAAALSPGGTFFPFKGLAYSATFGTAMRPAGIRAGWIDAAVQAATSKLGITAGGKPIGVRSDPTLMADALLVRAPLQIGALLVDRGAKVLHNSILTDGMLTRALGPQTKQQLADAIARRYKNSNIYDLEKRGLMGPSSFGSVDPARAYNQARSMLEGQNLPAHSMSLLGDVMHAITSSPAQSLIAMNKNADQKLLNSAIRNFSGDPGRSGSFKNAKWRAEAVNASPWTNLYLQSAYRMAEMFRRDPIGTTLGIFSGAAGVGAIGATLWNAMLGKEYSDYQTNLRSPDNEASSVYVGMPGHPPHEGVEFPVDPWLRPFKAMSEVTALWQLGILDGSYFNDSNSDFAVAMKEGSTSRHTTFGKNTVPGAVLQQSILPPIPPLLAAVPAAFGVTPRSYIEGRIQPQTRPSGFTEGEGTNPHTLFSKYMPAQTEDVLRALGSQALGNIYRMFDDTATRMQEGQELAPALKQTYLNKSILAMGDSTRMLGSGPLFGTFLAKSPSTESADTILKAKLDGMRKVSEAFNSAKDAKEDFVGNKQRGYQPRLGQGPQPAADRDTEVIAQQMTQMYSMLQKTYAGINKDAYDQRASIQNSTKYSPERKRALMDEQAEVIVENNRKMLQDVQRYEAILSYKFGREIKFDSMKMR